MQYFVVDTNVAVIANEPPGSGSECAARCASAIEDVMQNWCLVVDDGFRIIKEYIRNLQTSEAQHVGNAFLKWVLSNRANPARCVEISVEALPDEGGFLVVSSCAHIDGFDPADHKFLAVAMTHDPRPTILEASDTEWWDRRADLKKCGITARFLCGNPYALIEG